MLKKFLSPETIGSVKIMNTDRKKWEKTILELIDDDMLPHSLGGKLIDENGDPKCSQMICYGGKIPADWYLSKQSSFDSVNSELDKLESEVNVVILSSEA